MRKSTISISFDAEKLGAIKQYMGKRESGLEKELNDVMQRLYEKYVPAPVREYIETRDSGEQEKPKTPVRPSRSNAVNRDKEDE